jgi:hypothetical protein
VIARIVGVSVWGVSALMVIVLLDWG